MSFITVNVNYQEHQNAGGDIIEVNRNRRPVKVKNQSVGKLKPRRLLLAGTKKLIETWDQQITT